MTAPDPTTDLVDPLICRDAGLLAAWKSAGGKVEHLDAVDRWQSTGRTTAEDFERGMESGFLYRLQPPKPGSGVDPHGPCDIAGCDRPAVAAFTGESGEVWLCGVHVVPAPGVGPPSTSCDRCSAMEAGR